MRKYTYIGMGGFIGAILRYIIKNIQLYHIVDWFPVNTFIINTLGCFVLAFFLRLAFDMWETASDLRLGIATGLLGAFTTFSTLCREAVGLMLKGSITFSLLYLTLSLVMGLAAVFLGDASAKGIISSNTMPEK